MQAAELADRQEPELDAQPEPELADRQAAELDAQQAVEQGLQHCYKDPLVDMGVLLLPYTIQ